jgi:hypothetical protein
VSVVRNEDQPAAGAESAKGGAAAKSEGREKTRTACAADVQKFCPNVERGKDAMRACLQANAAQLSEPCKAASAGQAGGKPREADARKPEGSSTQ